MTYKKILEQFNETELYLYKVVAATEVDNYAESYDLELTDDDFEAICAFVYDWTQNTEAAAWEVCQVLFALIYDETITLQDFKNNEDKITDAINNYF